MARRINMALLALLAKRRARKAAEERAERAARNRRGDNEVKVELFDAVGARGARKRRKANLAQAKIEAAKPSYPTIVESLHQAAGQGATAVPPPVKPRSNLILPESLAPRRAGHYDSLRLQGPGLALDLVSDSNATRRRKRHAAGSGLKLAVESAGRIARLIDTKDHGNAVRQSFDAWLGSQLPTAGRNASTIAVEHCTAPQDSDF